jgi:CitB family two-component system sensor histidine kinase MalK
VASARRRVALGILVGFLVGVPGAFFLAGGIKRVLMGMEPVEIATLLQQRMALLHCVREGVVAIDRGLRITLVNEEASRLFELAGIQGQAVGRPVEEVLPHSGMAEVLASGQAEYDRDDAINGLRILASRVPVLVDGEITGVVATFRDRTELRQLAEQLSGVRHYADALRSQTHEFMNKLHVILGLIRLGEYQRLGSYIAGITDRQQDEIGLVTQRIKEPVIAGFLLARFSSAREQNVEMRMDEDSHVPPGLGDGVVHLVVTVLGNLLENAVESLAPDGERRVDLSLVPAGSWLTIRVADTGLGLAPEVLPLLFSRNFSTKGENRGFGLYHCARRLADAGGTLAAANREGCGAVFTAVLEIDAEVPE